MTSDKIGAFLESLNSPQSVKVKNNNHLCPEMILYDKHCHAHKQEKSVRLYGQRANGPFNKS